MSLNKSEVIYLLAMYMSKADGDLSDEELDEVLNSNPVLEKAHAKVDQNVLLKKIKRGEASKPECIKALKKFPRETQIDALAVVLQVLAVDDKVSNGESNLMVELSREFNIDLDTLKNRYYVLCDLEPFAV